MELKSLIAPLEIKDYGLMVTKCWIISQNIEETLRLRAYQQRRSYGSDHSPRGWNLRPGQSSKGKALAANQSNCPRCDKSHVGSCPNDPIVCFRCEKQGHVSRNCQVRLPAANIDTPRPPVQGRVFAIEGREGNNTLDTMQGEGQIHGFPVTVLFDSGVSHAFISLACCQRLNLSTQYLP